MAEDLITRDFGTAPAALRGGARESIGVPMLVLCGSYLGFGALVQESGLAIWHGLFSTLTSWALPGQVALVELYSVGAPLLVIASAVALTNARLLPMAMTLMPTIRGANAPRWVYYAAAHVIAVTGWAAAMRVCPTLPTEQRLAYFAGFSGTLWISTLGATAIGFALANTVPAYVTLGLVFLNPIYFMLVFASDLRQRSRMLALVFGAVIGPPLYLWSPDWSLVVAGLAAGTLAYGISAARKAGS
ncbi:AzlC family ABC transporter permease [Denitrobaculum tricleocarpae]|uniref:AzlC family ABC transporter permease n=1 Tax=Denitrobaculum tricleocarpae TaxID=2591009 RepID=A0A545TQX2_9PROT|nr:AzlC family ABC transporter permease [Denitrobaculum tricleocarpae]TQV79619.1 AzlC family ABC transporter permease [Denitrobaculum tricleocarpae]